MLVSVISIRPLPAPVCDKITDQRQTAQAASAASWSGRGQFHRAAGEPYKPLVLEIFEQAGDDLPRAAQMSGDRVVGEREDNAVEQPALFDQKGRQPCIHLLYSVCSSSHITSEKRVAITSFV